MNAIDFSDVLRYSWQKDSWCPLLLTPAEAEKVAEVAEIQYNQRIMEKKKQKEISQVN